MADVLVEYTLTGDELVVYDVVELVKLLTKFKPAGKVHVPDDLVNWI